MRYTSSQYAKGLYEALKESDDKRAVVKKFAQVLLRHGKLANLRNIMLDFAEVSDKEAGIQKIEITSALPLKATDAVRETLGGKALVQEKIDPSIIGGMRIRVGDELIDNTIRKRLSDLRNMIAN